MSRASLLALLVFIVVLLFEGKAETKDSDNDITEQCPSVDSAIISLTSDDPYVVLNVARDATDSKIIKKYRALARKWHPDRKQTNLDITSTSTSFSTCDTVSTTQIFASIGHAYGILSDTEKRDVYDRLGLMGLRRLQDGDPRVKRGYLPPDEVLRRHGSKNDPPLPMMDWIITSIFAWLEGEPSYDN